MVMGNFTHELGLCVDLCLAADKFEEQRWTLMQASAAVRPYRANGECVQQLGPPERDAELNGFDHAVDSRAHVRKVDDGRRLRFRLRMQANGGFGDQPQRAFGTAVELREVVARRALART